MKKLLLFAFSLISFYSYAQETGSGTFEIGVKAGLNAADFGQDFQTNNLLLGGHAGVVVGMVLNNNFDVQLEGLYSMQGAKFSRNGLDYTEKLNYVSIPLLVKLYVGQGFSFHIGPQFSWLLNATRSGGEGGDLDIKEEYEPYDAGFCVGFSYLLLSDVSFGARYSTSLIDIDGAVTPGFTQTNNVIQLSIGYLLIK